MEVTWAEILMDKVFVPVATAVGIALAGYVTVLINRLTKKAGLELKEKQRHEVEEAVERAIMHTMQTFTDAARAAAADGKLTSEDAHKALQLTKERAVTELKQLGRAANGEAKRLLLDEVLLSDKIESLLPQAKTKTARGLQTLDKETAKKILEM
jgi:hypothetical protein